MAYSKRKIEDFLSTLGGFKAARTLLSKFKAVAPAFKLVLRYFVKVFFSFYTNLMYITVTTKHEIKLI